jgi:hypothetical protein
MTTMTATTTVRTMTADTTMTADATAVDGVAVMTIRTTDRPLP